MAEDDSQKPAAPAPMPRDKQGWRVAPAPDGRGMPDEHKPRPPHRLRGFWIFVIVLLAINWLSVLFLQPPGQPRVTVPFSPYFLQQVDSRQGEVDLVDGRHDPGHVQEQGALPARRQQGDADDAVLDPGAELLEQHGADDAAASTGRPGQREVDTQTHLAAGRDPARVRPDAAAGRPVRAARAPRAAARRRARRARQLRPLAGAAGRSGEDPGHVRRRRRDRRGEGRADRDRRLPARPRSGTSGSAGGCRTACCCSGRPGPARRCWRARSRARRTRRSSRSRRRSSSRRSSASAPRACATCSPRPRRPRRRSSSSTSSTRSAARGRGRPRITGANDEREQTLDQILTEMDGFESDRGGRRARRDQPARDPRPGAAAAGALRPPRRGAATRPRRPAEDPRGPHPLDPARRRRRSRTRSPRRRRGWSAPTSPTSPTRRRCWRRGATTTRCRWPTSPTRWRRSCSARRAGSCSAPRTASGPPTTSPGTRWSGC